MSNPLDAIKSGIADGNTQEKIDKSRGSYTDKVTETTDTMSKLPQASLPKAPDPSPFSIGPISK